MAFALLLALLPLASCSAATRYCASPGNAIVAENCRTGSPSTEWDVNGAGCPAVRGFAAVASAAPGASVDFKVKIDAGEVLAAVDVYRLGYYGGAGARRVGAAALRRTASSLAAAQPACAENATTRLYDCGSWAAVASWAVPGDAVSGLYLARFELGDQDRGWRADASPMGADPRHAIAGRDPTLPPDGSLPHAYGASGKNRLRASFRLARPRASHAFFVVTSTGEHDLVVATADLTWHAYNGYGGLTTYGSFDYPLEHEPHRAAYDLSDPNHLAARANARSYDTPLVTRDYRSVNAPLGPEYAAIRFLESNGYDVHYVTGIDLGDPATAADALKRSRAYLSAGHDEYWTYAQRAALEHSRAEDGLHLNFWSGNEAYWAVRLENRTMVCYKETQSTTKLDLADEWTGTFRDARAINPRGAMPENALTGTMFAANAQRTDSIRLDGARFGAHRAWRGTSLAASGAARYDGAAGVLGHEWDEVVDNGWSPPLLQRLSSTTVDNVQYIMDHGATFDTSTATHELALFRHPKSGAWTFGAGTVQWSWALDDFHDVNDPQRANKYDIRVEKDARGTSADLRRLTVNVLHDQGVVPASPDAGLEPIPAAADDDPPAATLEACTVEAGVLSAAGAASDAGGSVAAVEVSWVPGRWHIADMDRVGPEVRWSVTWGDEPWHALHGDVPPAPPPSLSIRAADDAGNVYEGAFPTPPSTRVEL